MHRIKFYKLKKFYHEKILKTFLIFYCIITGNSHGFHQICFYYKNYDEMLADTSPKETSTRRINEIKEKYKDVEKDYDEDYYY